MKLTFKLGLAAALIGAVGLFIGTMLSAQVQSAGLAAGAGVTLALVRQGNPLERLVGFLVGIAMGVFYIYMQLGALPGGASAMGNAVAIGIIILVIAILTAVTHRKISAWSMLLGVFAYVCAMIGVIESTPWTATEQVPLYIMSVLGASMVGYLTVIPVEFWSDKKPKPKAVDEGAEPPPSQPSADDQQAGQETNGVGPSVGAGIQILDGGK